MPTIRASDLPAEHQRLAGARVRRNKYGVADKGARTYNGRVYDSKAEADYARLLWADLWAGLIREMVEQPRIWLGVRENVYVPDFLIVDDETSAYYVDVKGVETPAFRKIKKLWKCYGRLDLHIVKRTKDGFETVEIIRTGGGA